MCEDYIEKFQLYEERLYYKEKAKELEELKEKLEKIMINNCEGCELEVNHYWKGDILLYETPQGIVRECRSTEIRDLLIKDKGHE